MLDELLPYYENELTYLRRLSKEFASKYPKIASRLQMEGEVGPAHRDADAVATLGQGPHDVTPDKTRSPEHGDERRKVGQGHDGLLGIGVRRMR